MLAGRPHGFGKYYTLRVSSTGRGRYKMHAQGEQYRVWAVQDACLSSQLFNSSRLKLQSLKCM